jgi:hypothetical protein
MMIADGGGAQHDLDLALGVRARTGLSGKSALAVDVGPLGAGTGAGVAENGPLKATGFAVGMGRDRNRDFRACTCGPLEEATAAVTIREMKWFEVVQTRGHIENGSVRHYQVTLRVGFTLEE